MASKTKYVLFGVAILLLLVGAVAWRFINRSAAADPRKKLTPLVNVDAPRRENVEYDLKFTGDITAIQQASIYSKVSGNLDRIYADIGMPVAQGQLLALIDTTELAQQRQQAAATYQNAKLSYDRNKELSEQNLVAKQDVDNSEAAMIVAKANFDGAATRMSYAWITAPFRGTITKRYLDPGANVTSNNSILFNLMDLDQLKVIINILEKDIPRVSIGKEATITVDAFPGEKFTGKITRQSEAVDLSTRTMAVEFDIPNGNHRLKPGMFANVTLGIETHDNALTLPTQTILKDDKGTYVLTVDNDNTATRKAVTLGVEQNGRTEIISGLTGDERIIVTGQQFIKDGSPVTIQQ